MVTDNFRENCRPEPQNESREAGPEFRNKKNAGHQKARIPAPCGDPVPPVRPGKPRHRRFADLLQQFGAANAGSGCFADKGC